MDNLTHFFLQRLASSSTNLMPDLKGHECKFLMVNALWVMKCRAMTCPEQFIFFDHVHKKYICLYYTNDTNVSSELNDSNISYDLIARYIQGMKIVIYYTSIFRRLPS